METLIILVVFTLMLSGYVALGLRQTKAPERRLHAGTTPRKTCERTYWTTRWKGGCPSAGSCPYGMFGRLVKSGQSEQCSKCGRVVAYSDYDGREVFSDFVEDPEGPLVASLCSDGSHAPAIDVDYGLEWHPSPHGPGGRLIFATAITASSYLKAAEAFERIGLGARTESECVLEAGIAGYRSAADMRSEAAFELSVSARAVGSRTPGHFHLYIDFALAWNDYAVLLDGLASAGLIEPAFACAAAQHRKSFLRRSDRACEDPKNPTLPPIEPPPPRPVPDFDWAAWHAAAPKPRH